MAVANHYVVCEQSVAWFNARGDDRYFYECSDRLDELFAAGWRLIDSRGDTASVGWWRVELLKTRLSESARAFGGS